MFRSKQKLKVEKISFDESVKSPDYDLLPNETFSIYLPQES